MRGASSSESEIERYSKSDSAPDGEWWTEFPVGLYLQEVEDISMGNRRLDGVCVTSRPERRPERMYRPDARKKRQSGWFEGEEVVLIEYGRGPGAWAKYGQLDMRRRMFEMDWPSTKLGSAQIVMTKNYDRGNEDTKWMFKNELEGFEYMAEFDGEFYTYDAFLNIFD